MELHWDPLRKRDRGLGENLQYISAKIHEVTNLEESIIFYRDILRFKLLEKDETSAKFDCKNMLLHIKLGTPITFSGENLIVSHVSVDVDDIEKGFDYFYSQGVHFEINVSVSTGGGLSFAEGGGLTHTVGQAFLRDPDGYYFEICNCHLLTDFVLNKATDYNLDVYQEGYVKVDNTKMLNTVFKWSSKLIALASDAKDNIALLKSDPEAYFGEPLPKEKWPKTADSKILKNLIGRKVIYSSITQSFTNAEIKEILLQAGNHAPTAIKLMKRKIAYGETVRIYQPPGYFVEAIDVDEDGKAVKDGLLFDPKPLIAGATEHGEDQTAPEDTFGYEAKISSGTTDLGALGAYTHEDEFGISSVNHIGLIVSNVGAATNFCAHVLGLQQVRRPNFDRHGAWFTGGNLELHLILGNPLVPDSTDKGKDTNSIGIRVKDLALAVITLTEKHAENAYIMLEVEEDACYVRDPDGYVYKIHE